MSTSFETPAAHLESKPGAPDFGPATGLVCRECGASYALGAAYACIECFGPLEVGYDHSGVTRELIESGPQSLFDFARLLSPAAAPHLEALCRKSQALTRQRFGKVIRLFAPLYLSNECINNCAYCGFSRDNPIWRVTLSVPEVLREVELLATQGFRNILLVAGEHPKFVSNGYLRECIAAVRTRIPAVSIEVGPMETSEYYPMTAAGQQKLKAADNDGQIAAIGFDVGTGLGVYFSTGRADLGLTLRLGATNGTHLRLLLYWSPWPFLVAFPGGGELSLVAPITARTSFELRLQEADRAGDRVEVRAADVEDGLSNTFLVGEQFRFLECRTNGRACAIFSENSDNPAFAAAGHSPAGPDSSWAHNRAYGRIGAEVRVPIPDISKMDVVDDPFLRIFSPCGRFGSAHASLCHFVLGDGSVRPISFTIDPNVYLRLCNRADGEPIPADMW